MQDCERCDAKMDAHSLELMDYCAKCSKNLCAECMKKGCCGEVPAESGEMADNLEEDDA